MIVTKIKKIQCLRCPHSWTPRGTEVRICPACKSPYFDRPRRYDKKESALEPSEEVVTEDQESVSEKKPKRRVRKSLKKPRAKPKKHKENL